MKRDMELIRKIVLAAEDAPGGYLPYPIFKSDEYSESQIGYHAYLILQAGFATGVERGSLGAAGPEGILTSLTWEGHEFAAAARNNTVWKKTVEKIKGTTEAVTLPVLTQLLTSQMQKALGL